MPKSRAAKKKHHHYSGDASEKFWARVNALEGEEHAVLYSLGCVLQDLEERVLRQLANAEVMRPRGAGKAAKR